MTYTYETLDGKIQFEIKHPMADPALTKHPETGIPIRRVITGGNGFIWKKEKEGFRPADYKDSKIAKQVYGPKGHR